MTKAIDGRREKNVSALSAIRERGLITSVGYMNRYRASVRRAKKLLEGEPSIELRPGAKAGTLEVAVWMLQPNEAQIVARRIREILKRS